MFDPLPHEDHGHDIPRNAQLVALALFPGANRSQCSFAKTFELDERTLQGLDDLESRNLITITRYKGGSMVCNGRIVLRDYLPDFAPITPEESFPIGVSKS